MEREREREDEERGGTRQVDILSGSEKNESQRGVRVALPFHTYREERSISAILWLSDRIDRRLV